MLLLRATRPFAAHSLHRSRESAILLPQALAEIQFPPDFRMTAGFSRKRSLHTGREN
jgi:hypothetical protein